LFIIGKSKKLNLYSAALTPKTIFFMKRNFLSFGSLNRGSMNSKKLAIRSLALAFLVGAFTLNSCSEDGGTDMDASVDSDNLSMKIELAPNPKELIKIVGQSGDAGNEALKKTKTTTAPGPDRGRFNITIKYVVPVTDRQREVFDAAAARWERIIIKDVPSYTATSEEETIPSAFFGFPDAIGLNETADDIVIEVAIAPIDGPGSILGQAGPRFVRTDDFLTLSGVMFFDVDDLDFLEQLDLFEEVIVHEMGHVLGVGTLWNVEQFGFPRTLLEFTPDSPYFNGKMANVHWNAEGGTGELPVEGDFGPGTRLSHWDEGTLNNELMTGFLNLGENPLSRITAGSLRDLGYGTAVKGESYDLPKGTEGVDISEAGATGEGQGINIAEMETLLEPIGLVTIEN
jgi:hypothetical protein